MIGSRPYKCTFPGCSARFSRQDNSIQHYKTHIGANPIRGDGEPGNEARTQEELEEQEAQIAIGKKALEDGTAIAVIRDVVDDKGHKRERVERMVGIALSTRHPNRLGKGNADEGTSSRRPEEPLLTRSRALSEGTGTPLVAEMLRNQSQQSQEGGQQQPPPSSLAYESSPSGFHPFGGGGIGSIVAAEGSGLSTPGRSRAQSMHIGEPPAFHAFMGGHERFARLGQMPGGSIAGHVHSFDGTRLSGQPSTTTTDSPFGTSAMAHHMGGFDGSHNHFGSAGGNAMQSFSSGTGLTPLPLFTPRGFSDDASPSEPTAFMGRSDGTQGGQGMGFSSQRSTSGGKYESPRAEDDADDANAPPHLKLSWLR